MYLCKCRCLVWHVNVYIYYKKLQFKMLVVFSSIFVKDTKISFGYNFGGLWNIQNMSEYFWQEFVWIEKHYLYYTKHNKLKAFPQH